jgi:acyl carrier protein
MTPDQARQLIEEALVQVAPDVEPADLTPDTDLRDGLGLDSLDFLRFVEILSERSGKQIAEDDYPQLATPASAVKFLAGG